MLYYRRIWHQVNYWLNTFLIAICYFNHRIIIRKFVRFSSRNLLCWSNLNILKCVPFNLCLDVFSFTKVSWYSMHGTLKTQWTLHSRWFCHHSHGFDLVLVLSSSRIFMGWILPRQVYYLWQENEHITAQFTLLLNYT